MAGWGQALARTRKALAGAWRRVFGGERPDDLPLEDIEAVLLGADVEAPLVADIIGDIESDPRLRGGARQEALFRLLRSRLPDAAPDWLRRPDLTTVLVVGVNGSGKTTTCAKLAALARQRQRRPLLCAADTFRAAGSDQLRLWAARVGCDVVAGKTGADAAAVAYDALDAAHARGHDLLVIDTAGRMHTRQPLMQELEKVRRALQKRAPGAPEETWIVLDAALGRNAISQARQFHAVVPLTGVIVSKLDGSAKAGFVFSIARDLRVPIRFAGLGEGEHDLAPFDPDAFVRALLGEDADAGDR